jgi:antitoxin component of RelBE/YafQ-DinJ toxin-antitoxin module
MKDKTINVRLSAKDLERLERLQEHFALNASSVIRMLLKQADDAIPGEPLPPPTPIRPAKPQP